MFQFRCITRDASVIKNHQTLESALSQFHRALQEPWDYCQVNAVKGPLSTEPILGAVKEDKGWVIIQGHV